MAWNLTLYILSLIAAVVLGLEFTDESAYLVLGFAAASWLGGWAAADLWRGR